MLCYLAFPEVLCGKNRRYVSPEYLIGMEAQISWEMEALAPDSGSGLPAQPLKARKRALKISNLTLSFYSKN